MPTTFQGQERYRPYHLEIETPESGRIREVGMPRHRVREPSSFEGYPDSWISHTADPDDNTSSCEPDGTKRDGIRRLSRRDGAYAVAVVIDPWVTSPL